MSSISMQDKFGDLGRTRPQGNPYHGKVENNILTLPNGTTIPWAYGSSGCVYVKLPGNIPVQTPADELAQGLRFDDYVLLQGGNYPSATGAVIFVGWRYEPIPNVQWAIKAVAQYSADYLTDLKLTLTNSISSVTTTQVLSPGHALGLTGVGVNVASNHDGTRAIASVYTTQFQGSYLNRYKLLAIYELIATGGNDTVAPVISFQVIASPEEINPVNNYVQNNEVGSASGTFVCTVTALPRDGDRVWEYTVAPARDRSLYELITSNFTTVIGASWAPDNTIAVFEHVLSSHQFSQTTVTATSGTARLTETYANYMLVDSVDEPVTLHGTSTSVSSYDTQASVGVRGGIKHTYAHSNESITNTRQYSTVFRDNHYAAGSGVLDLSFDGWTPGDRSVVTTPAVTEGFPEITNANFSATNSAVMASFGVAIVYNNTSYGTSNPADYWLVAAVSATSKVDLSANPRHYEGGALPSIVAHPITGEFAYGPGCTFV